MTDILILIAGLALILAGANFLVDGSGAVAKRFGLSDFIVGITIVAIGTSTPEMVVSFISAIKGNTDMAVGNVVGSNIFNTLVILGVTAAIFPIHLTGNNIKKDIPFGLLAAFVLCVMGVDKYLDHTAENIISRTDGILLLTFFTVFMVYTIYSAKENPAGAAKKAPAGIFPDASPANSTQQGTLHATTAHKTSHSREQTKSRINDQDSSKHAAENLAKDPAKNSVKDHLKSLLKSFLNKDNELKSWVSVLMILGGLAALIYGGDLFIDSASSIAKKLGVSEAVIAITLMAGGTSLPELASSLVAAYKKKTDLALGNVLGSNIANIFLVLGGSAVIRPLGMGNIGFLDLGTLLISSLLIFVTAFTFKRKQIDRPEGIIFLFLYVVFIVLLLRK